MTADVIHGDCLDVLRTMPDASVSSVVTDPPYGLSFMGKAWDKALPDPTVWAECLRVLRPGGHAFIFGAPRLYHRLAVQVEDAGFEIRDCLMWMFGSGFPKSLDVSKAIDAAAGAEREVVGYSQGRSGSIHGGGQSVGSPDPVTAPATPEAARWSGWGTALKPAYEPILLCRKPLDGTVAANVLAHGVGGINVDGCRIEYASEADRAQTIVPRSDTSICRPAVTAGAQELPQSYRNGELHDPKHGRWPANVCLDETAAALLDEQTAASLHLAGNLGGTIRQHYGYTPGSRGAVSKVDAMPASPIDAHTGASRFFYTAKASREEREAGLGHLPRRVQDETRDPDAPGANNPRNRGGNGRANHHPTVKPLDLMRWLCRLITPRRGLVLDPFTGSGSTGCAAVLEGFSFIGIEREADFVEIARARIAHWTPRQTSLLDLMESA